MSHSESEAPWYDDVDVPALFTIGVVGSAITVATIFACVGVYNLYDSFDYDAKASMQQSESRIRLDRQAETLTRYGVVDESKNLYQIPIDEAMSRVVSDLETPREN